MLRNELKLNDMFLKAPNKIKKLHVTKDGDIIDNDELSNDFVTETMSVINKEITKWVNTNRSTCEFTTEIYHPSSNEKFMEIVSICIPSNTIGVSRIICNDYVIVHASDDEKINNRPFRINDVKSLLFYLKNNGLIKLLKFSIK